MKFYTVSRFYKYFFLLMIIIAVPCYIISFLTEGSLSKWTFRICDLCLGIYLYGSYFFLMCPGCEKGRIFPPWSGKYPCYCSKCGAEVWWDAPAGKARDMDQEIVSCEIEANGKLLRFWNLLFDLGIGCILVGVVGALFWSNSLIYAVIAGAVIALATRYIPGIFIHCPECGHRGVNMPIHNSNISWCFHCGAKIHWKKSK